MLVTLARSSAKGQAVRQGSWRKDGGGGGAPGKKGAGVGDELLALFCDVTVGTPMEGFWRKISCYYCNIV